LQFHKYHGAGNDFILVDARSDASISLSEQGINKICDRHFGIGADGLMLLLPSEEFDFRMKYFNSDGREGTMCGNGGRCITAFAKSLGINKHNFKFEAIDGVHYSEYLLDNSISLKMNDVKIVRRFPDGVFCDTGSPHFVFLHPSPHKADMADYGKTFRFDSRFGSGGANVNAISFNENNITIATYERGVEAETLSCGTGAVAAAIAVSAISEKTFDEYLVNAKGGLLSVKLKQDKEGNYFNIFLSGPAEFIFKGEILILQ